jgi:hypothetical protein
MPVIVFVEKPGELHVVVCFVQKPTLFIQLHLQVAPLDEQRV